MLHKKLLINYVIKDAYFLGKNDVFLSMHYLTLATFFDQSVPVYTWEMFSLAFTGMIYVLRKFAFTLPGKYSLPDEKKKKGVAKSAYIIEATMYECSIFWMSMMVCINFVSAFLTWGYDRETSLYLSRL